MFFQGEMIPPELLNLLRRELNELPEGKERRITRSTNGTQYAIRIRPISVDEDYTAVYFTARKAALSKNQTGIRFFSRQEAERKAYSGSFSFRTCTVLRQRMRPSWTAAWPRHHHRRRGNVHGADCRPPLYSGSPCRTAAGFHQL